MFNSFKNFERLRYRLSGDMKKLADNNKESSDSLKGEVSNTVFATVFSAFITEMAFRDNGNRLNLWLIIFQIAIFIGIYIISYVLYNLAYNKIAAEWDKRKVQSIDAGMSAMIQIQKDFDNIACDSIIVAKDYVKQFNRLPRKNKNYRTFYYYEIMHYLDTACDKTKELIENKDTCIRTLDTAVGVDIFRVVNIKYIMKEQDQFLEAQFNDICSADANKDSIIQQRSQIKEKINYISTHI